MLTTSWVEQAPVIGTTQNELNGIFTDFLSYFALFRHFWSYQSFAYLFCFSFLWGFGGFLKVYLLLFYFVFVLF